MAKYCKLKGGPALYLECKECDERACEQEDKTENITHRIIIAGTRDFDDYQVVRKLMSLHFAKIPADQIEIISGGASGADKLGEQFAKRNDLKLTIFPADWEKYGKAAGPIRNKQMADYASERKGYLVAFWDGKSRGTENMIQQAKENGLIVMCHMY